MFEVDPNLWLQSFASPALHWLMMAVTTLGYDWFYILGIMVLGFGVRLRPTLGMMLALLLAGLATHAAKTGFELPRPSDVDVRVLEKGEPHVPLVAHGGAERFLALPSAEARAAIRAQPHPDFGFVSGHVASATAMCLGLLAFFGVRRRAAWVAVCAWPLLMGISRMYLGRHFLGDVIGGLCVGALAASLAVWLLPRDAASQAGRRRLRMLAASVLVLCVAAVFTPQVERGTLGQLAGLVIVLAVLDWRGAPGDAGSLPRRVARVACLFTAYVAVKVAMRALAQAIGWGHDSLAWLPATAIATAAMFLGALWLAERLRLYRTPVPA